MIALFSPSWKVSFWPQLYKCGRCQGEGPQEKAESTSVFSQVIRDRGSHTCFCYFLWLRCPSSTLGAWFPFYPWMAEMMFTMLQSSPEDYMMSWITLMLKISSLLLHLLISLKSGCNFHLVVFENYYLGLFFLTMNISGIGMVSSTSWNKVITGGVSLLDL